jgi:hypothetical protein
MKTKITKIDDGYAIDVSKLDLASKAMICISKLYSADDSRSYEDDHVAIFSQGYIKALIDVFEGKVEIIKGVSE